MRRRSSRDAELIVVAGGNLALIYFNVSKERLTLEAIEEAYPDLVDALANHPGIGVLMVRSAEHGLICVGRNGIHYLEEDRVEGEDPLAVYGEHAVAAVKRLDAIEHVGDVAVVSLFDPETQEIAAFEELIGAHGGLGGAQTRPFLLYPADWELDQGPLIGAPDGLPAAAHLDGARARDDLRPDQGGCYERERAGNERRRVRTWVEVRVRWALGTRHVPGRLHEATRLGHGDEVLVHPEALDADRVDGSRVGSLEARVPLTAR